MHSIAPIKGEMLGKRFAAGAFDIVYACNCVDHTDDPIECLAQMLYVVRPGGVVVLRHKIAEGARNGYDGLHRWDIGLADVKVVIRNQRGDAFYPTWPIFSQASKVDGDWLITLLRKNP